MAGAPQHLVGLEHQLQVSRESALLGNYEASLVHFDGAISQVQRYLRTLDDPALRAKWLRAKEDLSGEFQIVKEIVAELSKLRAGSKAVPPPTASAPPPSQLLLRPDPVSVVGGPSGAAQQRDPDVWSPPKPPPERCPPPPRRAAPPDWARRDPQQAAAAAAAAAAAPQHGPGAARGARAAAAGYGAAAAADAPPAGGRRRGERKPPVPPRPKAERGGGRGARRFVDEVCAADAELASMIERDILERRPSVHWGDIAASRRRGADEPCA